VLIVQVEDTPAVTVKLDVAVPAKAGAMARQRRSAADKEKTLTTLRIVMALLSGLISPLPYHLIL
jgi:hypothetical protein